MAVGDDVQAAISAAERLTAAGYFSFKGYAGWPARGSGGDPDGWDNDTLVVHMDAKDAARLATELAALREERRRGAVRLIIQSRAGLVARVDDYCGPVPQNGQSIFWPLLEDDGTGDLSTATSEVLTVKSVTIGMIAWAAKGEAHLTGRPVTVVEVFV